MQSKCTEIRRGSLWSSNFHLAFSVRFFSKYHAIPFVRRITFMPGLPQRDHESRITSDKSQRYMNDQDSIARFILMRSQDWSYVVNSKRERVNVPFLFLIEFR